jgi:hypothetical protein
MWKIIDWGFCFMSRDFLKSSDIAEILRRKSEKGRTVEMSRGRKNETTPPT